MKRFKKILLISISVLVPVLLIVLMIASCDTAEYVDFCRDTNTTQTRQEFKNKNLPKKSYEELTQLKDEIEAKLKENGSDEYKISIREVDKKYDFVAISFDKATEELIESFKTKISDSEYVMIIECSQVQTNLGRH